MYDISQPTSVIITLLKSYLPQGKCNRVHLLHSRTRLEVLLFFFFFLVSSLFFLSSFFHPSSLPLSSIPHALFVFSPASPCRRQIETTFPYTVPPSQLITLHAPRCILARAAPKSHDVGGRQKYRGIGPRRCSYLPLITCKISPPLLLTT